jgi:hypothetical protein
MGMTIGDILKAGHRKIRHKDWLNQNCYIDFPSSKGFVGIFSENKNNWNFSVTDLTEPVWEPFEEDAEFTVKYDERDKSNNISNITIRGTKKFVLSIIKRLQMNLMATGNNTGKSYYPNSDFSKLEQIPFWPQSPVWLILYSVGRRQAKEYFVNILEAIATGKKIRLPNWAKGSIIETEGLKGVVKFNLTVAELASCAWEVAQEDDSFTIRWQKSNSEELSLRGSKKAVLEFIRLIKNCAFQLRYSITGNTTGKEYKEVCGNSDLQPF